MTPQDGTVSVRLLVFSGRRDPEWSLSGEDAEELMERIRAAVGGESIHAVAEAGLGYRGFLLMTGGDRPGGAGFQIFRGVVTEEPGPRARHWRDTAGAERILLEQARQREFGKILNAAGVPPQEPR